MTAIASNTPCPLAVPPPPPDAPVYVHPGRTLSSALSQTFTTVVGSGVAVCLWDPGRRVGGIAHFLLPEVGNAPPAPRYGDVAMRALLDELAALGANTLAMRARVYGGSAPPITTERGHLGDRNVAAALAFLKDRAIQVLERDVGGAGARKVVFTPSTGAAVMTRVGPA
jgi:chemotaxis protein CheD